MSSELELGRLRGGKEIVQVMQLVSGKFFCSCREFSIQDWRDLTSR